MKGKTGAEVFLACIKKTKHDKVGSYRVVASYLFTVKNIVKIVKKRIYTDFSR